MYKLSEHTQELLRLHNYFDGAIIFDQNAVAVFYFNKHPDLNPLTADEVIGKHLLELYPDLDPAQSTIMKALRTGQASPEVRQRLRNFRGQTSVQINTTLPILDGETIIGAIDFMQYAADEKTSASIYITPAFTRSHRPLYTADDIISESAVMAQVKKKIEKVAQTDSSVLIYGKTGTGKEMVAEAIHTGGDRRKNRFVCQNCAAIPSNLLESILFGTVRGSFTGAENRIGLFEYADGGTLFLDEINNLDINLQSKLLKAIEEQTITRVGDYQPKAVNVRVLAATNEDPAALLDAGRLRQDLYYRLRVVQINLPELRERPEDIACLTDHFILKYNQKMNRTIVGIHPDARQLLQKYPWPGNVRELENVIEGAFNFARDNLLQVCDMEFLSEALREENVPAVPVPDLTEGKTLRQMVREYERCLIADALERHGSLREVTAELGITRQNLNHKLHQYGLDQYSDNKLDNDKNF